MSISNRIAKNTFMLYIRQIIILLVSLYTIRVVLDELGVEDYGIYNVVTGVVTLLSFLNGTMSSASQRYFSFAIGEKSNRKLKSVFSVNLIIYLSIVLIGILLLETVGLWFIKNELVVPSERIDVVIFIFHFSVITFIFNILSTPFMALMIAHENMHYYALISIVEAFLKLGVVILLMYIDFDKLKLYSILIFSVSFFTTSIYLTVCLMKYSECQFRKFYWNKILFKEIVGFTGWTLFGQITSVTRNQAITILLNQAYSPVTVAARAIASNISSKINLFSSNFNIGLYPPIIKAYASDDKDGMYRLINNGSKITFFLMWIFAFPLILEMDVLLNIWLKKPPHEAVIFSRLALIESTILSISLPLATAARAPGRMKNYELTLGLLQFALFGIAWAVVKMGYPAYSVYIVAIIINIIMFYIRLKIVSKLIGLKIKFYTKGAIIPLTKVVLISTLLTLTVQRVLNEGIFYSIVVIIVSFITSALSMYFIGLDKVWQEKVILNLLKIIRK